MECSLSTTPENTGKGHSKQQRRCGGGARTAFEKLQAGGPWVTDAADWKARPGWQKVKGKWEAERPASGEQS